MKRFRFRLESVATVRRAAKNEALREMLERRTAWREVHDKILALERAFDDSQGEYSGVQLAGAMLLEHRFRAGARAALGELRVLEAQRKEELDQAVAKLIEARREEQVIQKLRERKLSEHRAEADRELGLFHDDVGTNRAARLRGKSSL